MEAEHGYSKGSKMITTHWDGDWETFKQKFEASADLNGLNDAVRVGQLLAEGKVTWPYSPMKTEMSDEIAKDQRFDGKSDEIATNQKLMERATVQSHRLASMLVLSLLDSTGIQNSIIGDRLRYEKDGVRAWTDLILHFEMSSKDLRVENLTKKWDYAALQVGEHPDKLWTELTPINQNLAKLGEEFKESHFMRRFVAGIKAQPGHPYKHVLTLYKGSVITGPPLKINQLRELLSDAYEDEKMANGQGIQNMKGFIVFKACEVCKKKGHTKEDCWVAHPDKKPKTRSKYERSMRNNEPWPTCWKCGKPGHTKKECKTRSSRNPQGIIAAITQPPTINDKQIYVDSACSYHLMADVQYLEPKSITCTAETITAVGGQKIHLTQKGTAKITTTGGTLTLTNTYYAQVVIGG